MTGPIGSGKTTLAGILESYGLLNLEVDAIGHQMLTAPGVQEKLLADFGSSVLEPGGGINRRELGGLAFASPDATARLNAIMHPPMIDEVKRRIAEPLAGDWKGILINAPLLYTMGLDRLCRWIIYVRAPSEIRLNRIVTTRGLSLERAKARLAAQDPEPCGDNRVLFCDNDGSLETLRSWAEKTHPLLLGFVESGNRKRPMAEETLSAQFDSEVLDPHDACIFENHSLTKLVVEITQRKDVPHCVMKHLLNGLFLVPVDSEKHAPGEISLYPDGLRRVVLYTSQKVLYHEMPIRTMHIHSTLRRIISDFFTVSSEGIRIALGDKKDLCLGPDLLGKLRMLSGPISRVAVEDLRKTDLEIAAGETFVISSPDPEPPLEFVRHLQDIFRGKPGVAGLYVFEGSFGGNKAGLIVGVAPIPGQDPAQFDPLWAAAMSGVEKWLNGRSCIDFMVLQDSDLAELVATTVPDIFLKD